MGIHKYNEISELFSKVSAQLQECGIISWLIKLKRSEGQFHILHTADIAQASECFSEAFSLIEKYDFKNDEDICKVEINHFMLNYYVNNTKLVTQLIENYLDNDFFHIQSQKQFLKALSIIKALIGLSRLTEAESAINYLNTCSISYPLPSSYQLFEYIQFWFDVKKKNINKILFRIKSIESKVLSEKYHLLSHESTILFHAYLTLNEKEKAANHLIRIKNSLHTVNSIFFNLHVDLMSFCYDSHYNKHQSPQEALSLLHKKSQELNLEGVFLETIRHYPMLMPTLPKEKNTPQKELPTKKALHIVDSNNFCANDIPIITEREKEVLQLINQGFSNHQIALDLKISLHTVKMHNKNIFKKLNVKNRFQAVNLALKYNIISAT